MCFLRLSPFRIFSLCNTVCRSPTVQSVQEHLSGPLASCTSRLWVCGPQTHARLYVVKIMHGMPYVIRQDGACILSKWSNGSSSTTYDKDGKCKKLFFGYFEFQRIRHLMSMPTMLPNVPAEINQADPRGLNTRRDARRTAVWVPTCERLYLKAWVW